MKYTKYSCASQALSCAKISRRTHLPIDSEFPNISSKPFGLGKKRTGTSCGAASSASRSFPQSVGVAPKKRKSGRNLSCGHGNSTGNRKSLTIRVQVGILRTLRLSCHKRYAQISITSQLYHKIFWLSRKHSVCKSNASCDFKFLIHHRNRRIWNIEKNIFFFCRKIKAESYFLYVRPFKHCTLTTEHPSGREIQQPRTVCDDMSVPTAQRYTATTAIRALDRSTGTDCQMAYKTKTAFSLFRERLHQIKSRYL